jgi:hypothetical protein
MEEIRWVDLKKIFDRSEKAVDRNGQRCFERIVLSRVLDRAEGGASRP